MAQIDSHYRRLQRFFSSGVCPSVFTELILSKAVRPGQCQLLVMDRTHWKLGRTDSMPLVWACSSTYSPTLCRTASRLGRLL